MRVDIPNNSTPSEHCQYVYDRFVIGTACRDIVMIAHSAGGANTVRLLESRERHLLPRLRGIAFTDSVHGVPMRRGGSPAKQALNTLACNWVTSDKPRDTQLGHRAGCRIVSSGHTKHEYTSGAAFPSVFPYLDRLLNRHHQRAQAEDIDDEQKTMNPIYKEHNFQDSGNTLDEIETRRMDGNTHFKQQNFSAAIESYLEASRLLEEMDIPIDDDQRAAMNNSKVVLNSNMSIAYFKLGDWENVISKASKALEIDPRNVKVLARRAHARLETGNLEDAKSDLDAALAVDSENTYVKSLNTRCKKALKKYKKKQKKLYEKMFK